MRARGKGYQPKIDSATAASIVKSPPSGGSSVTPSSSEKVRLEIKITGPDDKGCEEMAEVLRNLAKLIESIVETGGHLGDTEKQPGGG